MTNPLNTHLAHGERHNTIAILGAGAVGGLMAGLLSRAGHRVICIAREDTARKLKENGIQVKSRQHGNFGVRVEAQTDLTEPVDVCIVAVKQTSLDEALMRISESSVRDGVVLPLLNGIEHVSHLRERFGERQVVPGVIRVESSQTKSGKIAHGSPFTEIDLAGEADKVKDLAKLLNGAGVVTRMIPDEETVLWRKLAFLAPFALLTTLHSLPIGEILENYEKELASLLAEATATAEACGASVDPKKSMEQYSAFPHSAKSSMQRDAEARLPLETDAIGGALVRAAEAKGIATPNTKKVMEELRSIELRRTPR